MQKNVTESRFYAEAASQICTVMALFIRTDLHDRLP
ncbi:hypothetical protein EcWSU1_02940 [Enterobacter ludwigii]|uniref:Uncharacterized protein n=1 Tax=Enterobacter ludwigii TaxID=299767 RepID=G8LIS7_9ENTR|nr:hypothetical protein EcWSU1_02940 [Enterobacter ludwigii]